MLFIFAILSVLLAVGVYMINWCETLTIKGHTVESDHIGWAIVCGVGMFSLAIGIRAMSMWIAT